ncbi:MAG: glutamate--tRNA ligase, partial [Bellilinea sp.]
ILVILEGLPDLKPETAEPPMRELVETSGLKAGQVFGLMRIAITGQKVSPPLFESMEIIGKEKVVTRMLRAVEMLTSMG